MSVNQCDWPSEVNNVSRQAGTRDNFYQGVWCRTRTFLLQIHAYKKANFSRLQSSIMHFDKTGQCSEGRISGASKASISLDCDSWGLVGDTKLRENTRIIDNLNTELVFTTHLHIPHELLAKFGPKFAWSRHTCSANIAWHMRDSRTTLVR